MDNIIDETEFSTSNGLYNGNSSAILSYTRQKALYKMAEYDINDDVDIALTVKSYKEDGRIDVLIGISVEYAKAFFRYFEYWKYINEQKK